MSNEGRSKITRLDPSIVTDLNTRALIVDEVNRLLIMAQPDWNPHLKLDYAKMCIRTVVEKVQAERKVREKTEEDYLNVELDIAIKSLGNRTIPALERMELIDLIESLRNRKQVLIEEKGKRLADKLGSKWYNEGEKSTKYFLRIMNRANPDKFNSLESDSGEVLLDENSIREEIVNFYKSLYENYDKQSLNINNDDSFFDEIAGLTPDEERAVSEPITLEELAKTLATCRDSAPGPDGIPYSIIKALWHSFGTILVEAWNYSLRTGTLPQSHKVSFLKLIPKVGKEAKKLTNWRPITLSNCDHKIITKTYARRMSEKAAKYIEARQTAYLKGRLINDNVRSILASIRIANTETDINGLIVSLDAKKAFDSVEHSYIEKVLRKFGLSSFVPIFRLLYKDLRSDIIINGKVVQGFEIKRGVKQGDALSCILFIMCMEPMLRNIEKNARICGITSQGLNGEIPKLYAYADDVNAIIKNEPDSLQELFNEYSRLTNLSGLELNANKTEIMPIKSSNVRNNPGVQTFRINYRAEAHEIKTCQTTKINGILFQQDEERMRDNNVASVIRKTEEQLKKWSRRNLCILGKILIVKTFGVSQIIYLMQSMCLTPENFKTIKKTLYKFIWNRHFMAAKAPERVKREIVNKPIKKGGFGMLDIEELDASLKLRALGRLRDTAHPMLGLLREKLDLREFFFPEDKLRYDSVLSSAVSRLRENRQLSWGNDLIKSNIAYVSAIKNTRVSKALNQLGKNSLAFLALRMTNVNKLGDLNLGQLRSIRPFLNRNLYSTLEELNQIALVNLVAPGETSYDIVVKDKLLSLAKLSSKDIRTACCPCDPETIFKIGLLATPSESVSLMTEINRIVSVKHKDMLLRLLHGELYSKDRLSRYGLTDSAECPRCLGIETLYHKYIECPYAVAIWAKCLYKTEKLRQSTQPHEELLEKIYTSSEPNLLSLTIHAEILLKIRVLKDEDHLLLPKILVKNAIASLIKKEKNTEVRGKLRELLND